MTCISPRPGVIVCYASDRFLRRRIRMCPTEGRRRRFVYRYEAWYGVTVMCVGCGESWQDGDRSPRPFERGWRQRRIERYRALYQQAVSGPAPTLEELYPEVVA